MSQIFLLRLSSCSKSHLVQNPTLFKIPPCSKSHLAQNPILLSLFLFPLRLLSISLLILRLAQSPNLLKHPSGSNSCLAVPLLVPHLLVENVLADSHTCCQSACSLYRLLFVSLLTLHLLKGAGPRVSIQQVVSKGKVKHRKNCECCPVSQLIVR